MTDVPVTLNETLYQVIITGACNFATSDLAVLTVGDTGIDIQPANVTICNVGPVNASFTVDASDDATAYQWQEDQGGDNWTNIVNGGIYSGADTVTLSLTGLTTANSGWKYRVFVTGISSATSNPAVLTVNQSAVINADPTNQTVCYAGGLVTFNTTVTGASSIQWQYSPDGGANWNGVSNGTPTGVTYTGALTASLSVTTTAITPTSGNYSYRALANSPAPCAAVNSASAQLLFYTPVISSQPIASTAPAGSSTTYTVGTLEPSPTYQWQTAVAVGGPYTNVANGTPTGITYSGATSATLTVDVSGSASVGSARFYRAVVSSAGCPVNSNGAQLTIVSYCVSEATQTADEEIYSVTLNGSSTPAAYANANGCTTVAPGPGSLLSRYSNFTTLAPLTSIMQASTVPFSVVENECDGPTFYPFGTAIYIDYNRDGDFIDAGELAFVENTTAIGPRTVSGFITVPATATPGNTRMRVIIAENISGAGLTPCLSYGYGETEDHTITIVAAPACSGTPLAGIAAASPASICVSGTTTLSSAGYTQGFTGVSLQWFNGATNTAIAGATNPTYTTPVLNSDASYFLRITCANGGGSSDSNTVSVPVYNPLVASTTPATRCGPGALTLLATGSTGTTLNWFTTSFGGTSIFTGGSYTIPNVDVTTTYYVQASISTCNSPRTAVTATITPAPAVTISSSAATICSGNATPTVTITSPMATFDIYTWSPATGVSGRAAAGYSFTPTVSTVYTLTATQTGGTLCQNTTTYNVTVNQSPTAITITPSSASVCSNGAAQLLTASGGIVPLTAVPILTENFNLSAPSWAIVNAGTSPAISNFVYQTSPHTYSFSTFSTANGGAFAFANADAGGSGSTTDTKLISPTFSTVGYSSASLSFEHFYQIYFADVTVALEISTNGGSTWSTLVNYIGTSVGSPTAPAPAVVSLNAYLGQSNLKIRYNYVSAYGFYWSIDNVVVSGSGSGQGNVIWSPTAGLFTNAAATIPYAGTPALSVYAKPLATQTYTTTVTTSAGCPRTNTVTVSVETAANYYADVDGDGYGNLASTYFGCSQAGFVTNSTDCNDNVAAINPGQSEVLYDGVDNNCNNQLDEGFQIKTKLLPEICGATLASIGSLIGITTVSSAITGYRIRVTNGTQVQIIERTVPHFSLPNLPLYDYATTYTVEIELQRNGVWLGYYGDPCLVSSPAVLAQGGATQVNPSQCGITLARINTLIATTSLQGVTGYRFKVTNITAGASGPNIIQTIDRVQHWFSLVMLTQYNYASTYRVEVAVRTNGIYSGFGSPCEVSSPAAPQLINCGGVVATPSTLVAATSLQGVTQYRFQIVRMSDNATTTIDRNINSFTFTLVPGYTPASQYAVRVAVMTVGTWSPFGDACVITSPGAAARFISETATTASDTFKAVAYPNPFASTFAIDVTTSATEKDQIRVYDMTGRLIETREAVKSDLNTLQVGDRYPSGVYNVIVTQGANVETLRVIKR